MGCPWSKHFRLTPRSANDHDANHRTYIQPRTYNHSNSYINSYNKNTTKARHSVNDGASSSYVTGKPPATSNNFATAPRYPATDPATSSRTSRANYQRETNYHNVASEHFTTTPRHLLSYGTAGKPPATSSSTTRSASTTCTTCNSQSATPTRRHRLQPGRAISSSTQWETKYASSYSVRNLTFTVESSPKDPNFICQTDVVYHSQWTTAKAIIVDVDNKQVNISEGSVQITCSNPNIEFRNARLKHNGRLQFSMKASVTGREIALNITIRRYSDVIVITKSVNVVYNPSSSLLSQMTICGDIQEYADGKNCVFRVHVIDVFGNPAVKNSQNKCNIEVVLDGSHDDHVTVKKSIHLDHGHELCFDLTVQARVPWASYIVVLLNGKKLKPAERFELSNEEQQKLLKRRSDAVDRNDHESIPSSVVYDDTHGVSNVYLLIPKHCDDGIILSLDDETCVIKRLGGTGNYEVICKHTTKNAIMGPDFAHVNNIKRVLDLKDRLPIEETAGQTSLIFRDCNLSFQDIKHCKEVVMHLLHGSYYRKKASQCARVRMEWKEKYNGLLDKNLPRSCFMSTGPTVKFCKYFRDHYGDMMNQYNRKACDELFSFFNYSRAESEVDLHGLLVADEQKLAALKLDMLRGALSDKEIEDTIRNSCRVDAYKGRPLNTVIMDLLGGCLPSDEVEEFIDRCNTRNVNLEHVRRDLVRRCERSKEVDCMINGWRNESDEAIRMLERKFEHFNLERAIQNNSPWIEIIVGAGHHSRKKETQNIRPKVEMFLKKRGEEFDAVNKGSLVVTFVDYAGPEPCFAEYYCSNCDRCWKSSKSYKGKYQKCSKCHQECWPVKQREKEQVLNYRRDGKGEGHNNYSKAHQSHLCQKCQELGYSCKEMGLLH